MDSTAAFLTLLHEPKGTYLLRENDKGDLRFSVRSQLDHDPDDDSRRWLCPPDTRDYHDKSTRS